MISVQEAKERIGIQTSFTRTVLLPLAEAAGCVLAANITAKVDIPNFAQSSMDGYAIRFSDKQLAKRIIGEMAAGTAVELRINSGEAARIFTGAPLPKGADTVLMQEKATVEKGLLYAHDPDLYKGLYVRPKGSEVKAGELAMASGTLLSAAAIGFLAGIGETEVVVFAPPKVAIILTGNELQQAGKPLAFGQVYEASSLSLSAALKKVGVNTIRIFEAADNPETLTTVLSHAMEQHDLMLLIGGVSVGDYDFVPAAAARCGIAQHFHKIRQKPGKPLFFGSKGEKLVFGLPGNPASSLTCFYEYVLLALEKIMRKDQQLKILRAALTHDFKKPPGLTQFVKAFYEDGKVTPLHAQESYRLHSFAQANAFAVVPEAIEYCSAGDEVEIHLLPL